MVGRCMRAGTPFGVVQIVDGGEVGAVRETAAVGTSARIIDFQTLDSGLLGLLCLGEQVFRLAAREVRPDGLIVGEVTWLERAAPKSVAPGFAGLVDALRAVLPKLPPCYAQIPHDFADAEWVSFRLLELLPVSAAQRQHSLENHDAQARLEWLAPMMPTAV